jgi:hypothetical protein
VANLKNSLKRMIYYQQKIIDQYSVEEFSEAYIGILQHQARLIRRYNAARTRPGTPNKPSPPFDPKRTGTLIRLPVSAGRQRRRQS